MIDGYGEVLLKPGGMMSAYQITATEIAKLLGGHLHVGTSSTTSEQLARVIFHALLLFSFSVRAFLHLQVPSVSLLSKLRL